MATIDGISFEELDGSPSFSMDEMGVVCTRDFRVHDFQDWYGFCQNLVGTHKIVGTTVSYEKPKFALPGFANAFVSRLEVKPFHDEDSKATQTEGQTGSALLNGNFEDMNDHTNGARVTAVYEHLYCADPVDAHPGFSPGNLYPSGPRPEGTHLVYEAEFGGEYALTEAGNWKWSGTSDPVEGVQHGVLIPTVVHTIHWFWVIMPPWKKWRQMVGKVNSSTFLGAPAGTILLLGVQPTPLWRLQDGESGRNVYYRITYRFAETCKYLNDGTTQVGHNYFWRNDSTGEKWQEITDDRSKKPYETADFTQLFQYGDGTV